MRLLAPTPLVSRLLVVRRSRVVLFIVGRGFVRIVVVVRRTAIGVRVVGRAVVVIVHRGVSNIRVGHGAVYGRVRGPSAIDGRKVGPVSAGKVLMRHLFGGRLNVLFTHSRRLLAVGPGT